MVVACISLAVALGGVGVAANVLPVGSVGPRQIQKNAVTSIKVRNGSLVAADFRAGQLPAGPAGAKGDPGDPGPKGDSGPRGPSWGGAEGVGFGYAATTSFDPQGFKLTLPLDASGKAATQKFLVLGRITVELTCKTGATCYRRYVMTVNGKPVDLTTVTVSGKAGETVRDQASVFGVATVNVPRGSGLVPTKDVVLTWSVSGASNNAGSSTGTYVAAVALGK